MAMTQSAAVQLFVADGFSNVTMHAVAERAGIGVATLYRYFGTKEELVIWDANEEDVVDAIKTNLATLPPIAAVRAALVSAAPTYEVDATLELVRLACSEPAIVYATSLSDRQAANELASSFREHHPSMSPVAASTVARSCLGALEAALDHWQETDESTGLTALIEEAFDAISAEQQ